jgi:hypothetical protein
MLWTLQTTAKDHTLALKEHSTEVDALYNKIIELESRIEGQEQYSKRTRASNTLSVIVYLILGAFLGMMSDRSEIEFRRLICLFSCFSVAGRSSGRSMRKIQLVE